MVLIDTGPAVALIDEDDPNHARCTQALATLSPDTTLLTTWACLTEAMYLLHRAGGHPAGEKLWRFIERGLIMLAELDSEAAGRCRHLMGKYRTIPCDLADATLIVLAEMTGTHRIFTIDGHFYVYRTSSGNAFDVFPGPAR